MIRTPDATKLFAALEPPWLGELADQAYALRREHDLARALASPRGRLAADRSAVPGRLRQRRQFARRVAVAGALSVTLAAGLTLAEVFSAGETGTGNGPVGLLPAATVANATELGDRAARAVENDPAPRPTQWMYLKTLLRTFPPAANQTKEFWKRVDGERVATSNGGALVFHRGRKFPFLAPRIPADPDKALAFFREEVAKLSYTSGEGRTKPRSSRLENEAVFGMIQQTLRTEPLSPEVQAVLYRTLPKIPGVELVHDIKDVSGRPGIAFGMTAFGRAAFGAIRSEIVLDARTFRYLGSQSVAMTDLPAKSLGDNSPDTAFPGAKAGSVLDGDATLARSIVDRPGERG
jgi:hypothetical protein